MKKAFDANVSRARPRLRLGSMLATSEAASVSDLVESLAQAVAQEPVIPSRESPPDLTQALRSKLSARASKPTAAEALAAAVQGGDEVEAFAPAVARPVLPLEPAPRAEAQPRPGHQARSETFEPVATSAPQGSALRTDAPQDVFEAPAMRHAPFASSHGDAPDEAVRAASRSAPSTRDAVEAPHEVREVQNAPLEVPAPDAAERRERLRERLKAVRQNPRPEPLPDTVAEAGVLAVERIAALQTELAKTRALNLALSQDLEAARRQAERATEEARLRMDEARRLSAEMDGRVKLLADLERELGSLEGERNEALLALQEARQMMDSQDHEKTALVEQLAAKDQDLESSLQEEERLASELEATHETMATLRRSADVLKTERDTLARQVSELTTERAELLEARKALEAVHRALARASAIA